MGSNQPGRRGHPRLGFPFDIRRDEKAIEWVRKQADGYGTTLKAVSDSIMQEDMKGKSPTDNLKSD